MTLVDSSELTIWRQLQNWARVRQNMHRVRAFEGSGLRPHDIPSQLKTFGYSIGVVTASPRWYAEQLLKTFGIEYDELVAYHDTEAHKPDPEPIKLALERLGADPKRSFHVGDAAIDFEASYHARVQAIGAGWGVEDFESLSSVAPDLLLFRPDRLLGVAEFERRGYVAEVRAAAGEPLLHLGSLLRCGGSVPRYALGRYFTTGDSRHGSSRLSAHVLSLKNADGPAAAFGQALGDGLSKLKWKPHFIVPVPPKPSQTRNRFEALLGHAEPHLDSGIKVYVDGLRCVKEIDGYKNMKPDDRAAAVRGAFESKYTWGGGRVLLVDDVLTTGETVAECARVLLKNKASEVRILALAKDQRSLEIKLCPICGLRMKVRTNSQSGEKFWGCSGWKAPPETGCNYTESL
ncbi:MAG: HAD-IA family hydrolase [Planctomycetes bacterium]|nr:HAD-IA family hydrolase [Planctomycetota bacterium]